MKKIKKFTNFIAKNERNWLIFGIFMCFLWIFVALIEKPWHYTYFLTGFMMIFAILNGIMFVDAIF